MFDTSEVLPYSFAHDPYEARRLFDDGTLPSVTRFLRQLDTVPMALINQWTVLSKFQPLAELRVRPEAAEFSAESGIGAAERLYVHIGRAVYRRALVIASREILPGIPRPFLARVLQPETDDCGPLLKLAGRTPSVVLAARGTVRIECVIFNRPDLLYVAE